MSDQVAPQGFRFGAFELRPAQRSLLVDGVPAALGGRAFDVLMVLFDRRSAPVSKAELLHAVWPSAVVEDNTLQVHVSALRKLLGPLSIATIPGRGYRFTALLDADGGPPEARPATLETPHNLHPPRTRFIGREAILAQCAALLRQTRLLTLTGIGGCGKTRLALQLAQQQMAAFPDGVWFVDLAPLREPQRIAATVAAVLGVREEAHTPLIDRLCSHLAQRRVLIVLDNCEHLIDAAAEVSDALVDRCAQLTIIATSREALGVAGEQVVAVRPLSLPAATECPQGRAAPSPPPEGVKETWGGPAFPCALAALQASEAVRLFIDRASLAQPDFAVDEHNAPAVAEICRRLDGIALAIELAASRVGMLPVAEISALLADRFRFLTGGSRAVPRQQTLQATLQWSHDSLPAPEQQLFRRLAVFAGGCTLSAAALVADGGDEYSVLALLQRLHDKSLLVVQQDGAGQARYRMLETVRQYALDVLGQAGEADAARDRHLASIVALAEQALAQVQGPQQGAWMLRLAQEQEDILAAHHWCLRAAEGPQAAIRLVAGLWRYWVASGQLDRGQALAEQALADAPAQLDPLWHCRARWAIGQITFRRGRYSESLAHAEQSLAMAVAIADAELIAISHSLRAKGLHATGRLDEARLHYELACKAARKLDSPFWLGAALNNLAELHRSMGQLEAAQACYEEAITITRQLQSPEGIFVPLCNLARLSVLAGKLERARCLLLESLQLATDAELKGMGEDVLEAAAGLASARLEPALAARFYGAAMARMQDSGSQREPVDEAFVAPLMATAEAALGQAAFALACAQGRALQREAAIVEVKRWLDRPA